MSVIKPGVNYRLPNLQAGTYLTISDNDNVSIVGQPYADTLAQQWIFEPSGGNAYFIKSANPEPQYISLPSDGIVAGKQLLVDTQPFVWNVLNVPDMTSVVRITPAAASNLYVDLWEASPAPGTKIQIWPQSGDNQLWILEEVRN